MAKIDQQKTLHPAVRAYLAKIGRIGGKRSTRSLSNAQSKQMLRVREARRAFKNFQALCFWSYDPGIKITSNDDIAWVIESLMKNGNREAWEVAERLCR